MIYLPYSVIITDFLEQLAEQLAAGPVVGALINARKSGARYGLVSSFNCDRHFRFFKATNYTFPFRTRESTMVSFF